MNYKLYTLVDITHTSEYRLREDNNHRRWQEQNFNTVIQTLGLRSNVSFHDAPVTVEIKGSALGFNTDEIVRIWRFDFSTDKPDLYDYQGDPVELLREDFELVPYIDGLNESMEQNYAVFVPYGDNKNIVFYKK
jgi:hypothetical protein